jgi:hypothetical protein
MTTCTCAALASSTGSHSPLCPLYASKVTTPAPPDDGLASRIADLRRKVGPLEREDLRYGWTSNHAELARVVGTLIEVVAELARKRGGMDEDK